MTLAYHQHNNHNHNIESHTRLDFNTSASDLQSKHMSLIPNRIIALIYEAPFLLFPLPVLLLILQ